MAMKKIREALADFIRPDKGSRKYEVSDPTPVAPPVGYIKQPSLAEMIRNQVRSEQLRAYAAANDLETFEEADDFEIGDDYDPTSPYENDFDPSVKELQARERALAAAQQPPASPAPTAPATPAAPPEPPQAPQPPLRQAP